MVDDVLLLIGESFPGEISYNVDIFMPITYIGSIPSSLLCRNFWCENRFKFVDLSDHDIRP